MQRFGRFIPSAGAAGHHPICPGPTPGPEEHPRNQPMASAKEGPGPRPAACRLGYDNGRVDPWGVRPGDLRCEAYRTIMQLYALGDGHGMSPFSKFAQESSHHSAHLRGVGKTPGVGLGCHEGWCELKARLRVLAGLPSREAPRGARPWQKVLAPEPAAIIQSVPAVEGLATGCVSRGTGERRGARDEHSRSSRWPQTQIPK
jgi:hypothetical protein